MSGPAGSTPWKQDTEREKPKSFLGLLSSSLCAGPDQATPLPNRHRYYRRNPIAKPNVTQRMGGFAQLRRNPGRQAGRQMGIHPNHAGIKTGWLSLRLAYCRQALMSSASRSGSSSKTCSGVKPFPNRSRTSMTRMRMPLMQGRPPHCSGSTVIRFTAVLYSFQAGFAFPISVSAGPRGEFPQAAEPGGFAPNRSGCSFKGIRGKRNVLSQLRWGHHPHPFPILGGWRRLGRPFRAGVFLCLTFPRAAVGPRLPWARLGRAVGAPTTQPGGMVDDSPGHGVGWCLIPAPGPSGGATVA